MAVALACLIAGIIVTGYSAVRLVMQLNSIDVNLCVEIAWLTSCPPAKNQDHNWLGAWLLFLLGGSLILIGTYMLLRTRRSREWPR